MKKNYFSLSKLLLAGVLMPAMVATAATPEDVVTGGWTFPSIESNGGLILGTPTATGTTLTIPSTYNSKPITGIVNSALNNISGLTSVIIPSNVTALNSTMPMAATGGSVVTQTFPTT